MSPIRFQCFRCHKPHKDNVILATVTNLSAAASEHQKAWTILML